MSDSDSDNPPKTNQPVTLSSEQFAEFMRLSMSQKNQTQQPQSIESLGEVRLAEKLNGDNYPLWAKLMRRGIRGKGLASHITGVTDPPPPTDPSYNRWQQRDDCCFNWIISNIDASLVNEVSQYETAFDLWDSLATTYGSGADQFQISDLHRQAYTIKQGELPLENLWQKLQDLWISIDTRDPNPMDTPSSIEKYNQNTQRHRLYQFIWALDDHRYSKIKREILNMEPIPSARKAYGLVRRESVNEKLLNPEPGIGVGLATFDRFRTPTTQHNQPQRNPKDEDKSKLVCSHCGGKKHTRETCFHIHGFPEWWEEMKRARQARNSGRNGGGRGGGRASAAVALEHATYTEVPAGGSGGSGDGRVKASGGETRATEQPQIASVALARTWSEGNVSRIRDPIGADGAEQRTRVQTNQLGAARVSQYLNTQLSEIPKSTPKSQYPQPQPTNTPHHPLKSHISPHPENTHQNRPQNSRKYQSHPCRLNISQTQPQTLTKFQTRPLLAKTLHIIPQDSILVHHQPNVPCRNSFDALACSSTSTSGPKDPHWIFDCGATDTISFEASDFVSIATSKKSYVQTASGDLARVMGAGTIHISPTLCLSNCLFVPSLSHKLLSISHVTRELHCKLLMQPRFCMLQDIKTGTIVGRGTERNGLYYVDEIAQQSAALMLTPGPTDRQAWLWHRRLGHPSLGYFRLLFPELARSLNSFHCDTCVLAKNHRHSFKLNNTRVKTPFALVHSDVWGPAPITGGQGFRYFVLFIDDYSRMTWIYFLKNKHDVFDKFVDFYNLIQTQYKQTIQTLRSDNGGEFVNNKMQEFFRTKGLIHQTSCAYNPEQNGVAERKNRYILEITRALLIESKIPKSFWPESISTAVYLINRLPTGILGFKTPLDVFSQHFEIPSSLSLEPRVFGCSVFVHIPKHERTKFDPCALKCIFLGYGKNQKGYRCYEPKTRKIHTTMNCDFVEGEYFYDQSSSQGETSDNSPKDDHLDWLPDIGNHHLGGESQTGGESQPSPVTDVGPPEKVSNTAGPSSPVVQTEEQSGNDQPSAPSSIPEVSSSELDNTPSECTNLDRGTNEECGVSRETRGSYELPSRRTRGVPPRRYSPEWKGRKAKYAVSNIAHSHLSEMARAFETALYEEEDIPQTFGEASRHKHWREAMKKEINALMKNDTWETCTLPAGKKPVGCRWIFTIKRRADGSIERYKARLVAKGYTQVYGVDYEETFSPVAKMETVRTLLSVAACKDWTLHQFDVTNAFLHGELEQNKEVYMEAPPGFSEEFGGGEVCRLRKTLYGLKQSPRIWFGRFCQAMTKHGFQQSHSDHTLFTKKRDNKVTCLIIYVDDMIITGDDAEEIQRLKENLFKEFEMKDLGALKYFLGIEVLRSRHGIFLRQKKYVLDLLTETGLLESKPTDTPMVPNHGLKIEEGAELADRERYQRLVGKLIYLSHTRPDIAYAVGIVSQFMHQPQANHMEAALRIVRYLKGTIGYGIFLAKREDLEVDGYTDADWASNPVDRKSTGGYFTFIGGNLVTWRSKKQKVVALSSAEAEFRGMKSGLMEILWLRRLLAEIGFPPTRKSQLFCDNKAAISISENPVQHDRTKHVEVDRHFIKEKLEGGIIEFPFVRSEEQLADILTKAVHPKIFKEILGKLSIGDTIAQLEGECQTKSMELKEESAREGEDLGNN